MIVYLVTNHINGKVYVGKYVGDDPLIRWSAYVRHALRGAKQHLSNAIRKHGANAFIVSVIEHCTSEDELNLREAFHIERLRSNKLGYNMTTGGDGFSKGNTYRVGKKLTDNHKARISQANSKPKSPETIERMRIAQRNHPVSEIARQRMSDAQKRRVRVPYSEELKQKMRLTRASKPRKPPTERQIAARRANGLALRGVSRPPNAAQLAYYDSIRGVARPSYIGDKISIALKGKPFTQMHCDAIRRGKTGVHLTTAHRKTIGDAVRQARLRKHMDHVHMWMGVAEC